MMQSHSKEQLRREVISLWLAGLSYRQIAHELGVTKSAVAGHIYRHRQGEMGAEWWNAKAAEEYAKHHKAIEAKRAELDKILTKLDTEGTEPDAV